MSYITCPFCGGGMPGRPCECVNPARGHLPFIPQGCVCPPTSEKTCGNPTCPRKDRRMSAIEANERAKRERTKE